jgi:hypothetical protein
MSTIYTSFAQETAGRSHSIHPLDTYLAFLLSKLSHQDYERARHLLHAALNPGFASQLDQAEAEREAARQAKTAAEPEQISPSPLPRHRR